MSDFIVSFVGLKLSGKSSIIDSLLQYEICRITTEYKLIKQDFFDDKNNKFKVYDLPGICDSEETDNNNLIYTCIKN